jgi:hypothetical protein
MSDEAGVAGGEAGGEASGGSVEPTHWTDGFGDDLNNMVTNKGWETPMDLAKSYAALEKFHGVDEKHLMKMPGTPEEFGEVYSRLGRPDEAAGYNVEMPEGSSDQDKALAEFYKGLGFDLGLNQKQFDAMLGGIDEYSKQQMERWNQAKELQNRQDLDKLKEEEWGSAFDENVVKANQAMKRFGVDDDMKAALEDAMGKAAALKLFAEIGKGMGEAEMPGISSGAESGATEKAPALARLAEMEGDQNTVKILNDKSHPSHQAVKRERSNLYNIAYGGESG